MDGLPAYLPNPGVEPKMLARILMRKTEAAAKAVKGLAETGVGSLNPKPAVSSPLSGNAQTGGTFG